jgi:hypothetical protein
MSTAKGRKYNGKSVSHGHFMVEIGQKRKKNLQWPKRARIMAATWKRGYEMRLDCFTTEFTSVSFGRFFGRGWFAMGKIRS